MLIYHFILIIYAIPLKCCDQCLTTVVGHIRDKSIPIEMIHVTMSGLPFL